MCAIDAIVSYKKDCFSLFICPKKLSSNTTSGLQRNSTFLPNFPAGMIEAGGGQATWPRSYSLSIALSGLDHGIPLTALFLTTKLVSLLILYYVHKSVLLCLTATLLNIAFSWPQPHMCISSQLLGLFRAAQWK